MAKRFRRKVDCANVQSIFIVKSSGKSTKRHG